MMKSFNKHILCLLGAILLFAGCTRNDLAEIHNRIDALDLRTIREQIDGMKDGVANLQELQKFLEPAVANLQASKEVILADINELKSQIAIAGDATGKLKEELAFKEAQLQTIEKTIAGLESVRSGLTARIEALESSISASVTGLSDRVKALETAWQGLATLEQLAELEKYASDFPAEFDVNFYAALEECKQQLSQWVAESDEMKNLFSNYYDCAFIDAEIAGLNGIDEAQDEALKGISGTVSGLKDELLKMINDAINGVENRYKSSVEEIENTIKSIKSDIEDQYSLLWQKIGREDLAIEGSIVKAINLLLSLCEDIEFKSGDIANLVSVLRNDLDILRSDFIRSIGDDPQGADFASIHKGIDQLVELVLKKAAASDLDQLVDEAKDLTAEVQKDLADYIKANDEALKLYLTKEDAAKTYALISSCSELLAGLEELEGRFESYSEWAGSVMGWLSDLNQLVGEGKFADNWTADLTSAVNSLYSLTGTKLDADQVSDVAQGLVNDVIKALLGKDGSAEDVKALLDSIASSIGSFVDSVGALENKVGDISKFSSVSDPDIATAIANIKSVLAVLSDNYAAKQHTHTSAEITDLADTLSSAIESIAGKLVDLKTAAKNTLVDAINELHDKFGGYTVNTGVDALLSDLEAVLAAAVMNGTGYDGYFASLNLTALKNAIDEVVKTGGTVDSRISDAIEALNLSQYLKDIQLDSYDFISRSDVSGSVEILTALAALKVTLGEDVFEYGYIDDAVEAVYNALQDHISDYGELSITFSSVKSRLEAVEAMLGEGFSASNTISSVLGTINETIDGIEDLFDGIGTGESVKTLTDGLRDLFNALINALVGKTSGAALGDIDAENNLNALKAALDNLSFDTIKNSDGQSITQVLKAITDRITALQTTLGTGLDSGLTVIGELKRLSEALGSFKNSEYSQWTDSIDAEISNILNALAGNDATLDDLSDLIDLLDEFSGRLDNFKGVAGTSFESVINGLCTNLDNLYAVVGDCSGLGEAFVSIADEIAALRKSVESFKIDWSAEGILNAIQQIGTYLSSIYTINHYKEGTGLYTDTNPWDIFYLDLNRFRNPNLGLLNTSDKSDLVAAINELFDQLAPYDLVDLNKLKAAIIGEGSSYISLKAIAAVFEVIVAELGNKPDGFENDVYSAIMAVKQTEATLADLLGTNETEYDSVWEAINNLKVLFISRYVNSLVFVPEYDDGMATAVASGNVFKVDMSFIVNVPSSIAGIMDQGAIPVKGLLKTPSNLSGMGTEIDGNASYSDGVLSVSFFVRQKFEAGSRLAVVLGSVKNGFVSEYIPLHIHNQSLKRIKSADPASGTTFKFLAGVGGSHSVTFVPENKLDDLSDISGSENINSLSVESNGLVKNIVATSNISSGNKGNVTFSDGDTDYTYNIQVNPVSEVMVLNNISYSDSNRRFSARYQQSVSITFNGLSDYGFSGTLTASFDKFNGYRDFIDESSFKVEGNTISFNTLSKPSSGTARAGLTVKIGDVTLMNNVQIRPND